MPEMLNNSDDYDEEWRVIVSGGGKYTLSKNQARLLLQEMANGNRGVIPFQTFVISIPYVIEFYRVKRFLKNAKQLPSTASEKPFKPLSPKKLKEFRKEVYSAVGKPIK